MAGPDLTEHMMKYVTEARCTSVQVALAVSLLHTVQDELNQQGIEYAFCPRFGHTALHISLVTPEGTLSKIRWDISINSCHPSGIAFTIQYNVLPVVTVRYYVFSAKHSMSRMKKVVNGKITASKNDLPMLVEHLETWNKSLTASKQTKSNFLEMVRSVL